MANYELNAFFVYNGFVVEKTLALGKTFFFEQRLLDSFSRDRYKALWEFGFAPKNNYFVPAISFLHELSTCFIDCIATDATVEISRQAPLLPPKRSLGLLRSVPFASGAFLVNADWLQHTWSKLGEIFEADIASFDGSIADYLRARNESIRPVGRVYFHLVQSTFEEAPFAFLATYTTGTRNKIQHLPLKNALLEYKEDHDKLLSLLSTVSKVTEKSAFIFELFSSGELFAPLKFTAAEAHAFLKEVPLYEECGVVCRIPDWWRKKYSSRLAVAIGERPTTALGLDTILSFDPQIYLGDTPLSRTEVAEMLQGADGLSLIKGRWVEVDHEKLQAVLAAFDQAATTGSITLTEALHLQLGLGKPLATLDVEELELSNGQWLQEYQAQLSNLNQLEQLPISPDFAGKLRPYQQLGFSWLGLMQRFGFGALLADDMGLGKTIQVLALLSYLRQSRQIKTLLIVPASLLGNWQNELAKFTPQISYQVLHSNSREFDPTAAELFITTYAMLNRLDGLQSFEWDIQIADEAQAIKNPGTKQSKAVKAIKAKFRIAITGTPIENNLADLWSLFDYLNKGLLGSGSEFGKFITALRYQPQGYNRLRQIISPFILRRLKSDKNIIADLPDKIEVTIFTTLSRKQSLLYSQYVSKMAERLEESVGIERRGLLLASLTKLKQICNHPDHYLGGGDFSPKSSGKFQQLQELCETIVQNREKLLVFTQFREMCEPLAAYLTEVFGRSGLVLHGQTPVSQRSQLVEEFNSESYIPFMVLSLKAGGLGLNLTAANHVVHFDRWWNPAVENQATDRAYRIGQQKNVLVHKFVTKGTLEEKIEQMLIQKQKLAGDIIAASGENWIFELDNQELLELFRLEA